MGSAVAESGEGRIIVSLKRKLVPEIGKLGFRGSFPRFKRKEDSTYEFITIQFGRSSLAGKFVIEFGRVIETDLPDWARSSPERIDYGLAKHRHRVGSPGPGEDGTWFDFSALKNVEDADTIAEAAKDALVRDLSWFSHGE